MNNFKNKVMETTDFLTKRISISPEVGVLTGTGLAGSIGSMERSETFDYSDIPNFPVSTVESHAGKLLFGRVEKQPVVVMQGRFHLYEGYSPLEVTFPIRVMQELGINTLIVTNAAGGLTPGFRPGDIMLITDHINLTGENPLVGPNEGSWGIRFPDMIRAYDPELRKLAQKAGRHAGITLQQGVYAGLKGPSLETPAEIRFLKTIGANAVGLSTVQEVIAAVHAGMKVLGLSTITNVNNPDTPSPATVEDIIAVAEQAAVKVGTIITHVIRNFTAHDHNS